MTKNDHIPAAVHGSRTNIGIVVMAVFVVLFVAGLCSPGISAAAPVTVINQFSTTPCGTGNAGATSNITCTSPPIGAGSNRVLVLIVTGEANGNHNPASTTATFGSATFTEVQNSYGTNDNRRYTWMGYINESQITGNSGSNIGVTLTSSASWVSTEAYYAVYGNVDQAAPVSGSVKADSPNTTATVSMGPITTVLDGIAIYSISANATTGNTTVPASYTEHVDQIDTTGANFFVTMGSRSALPGTSESVSMTAVNARWTAAFMALAPAPAGSPGSIQLSSSAYSVSENGGSVTITATRTGGSAGAVGISYSTSNGTASAGSDYTSASGTLSWADGDAADKSFAINITDDGVVEGNETLTASLNSPTGGATSGSPALATVTITDDDVASPGTVQFSASGYSIDESSGTATITVTRTGGSSGPASVNFATSNGTAIQPGDYTSASGTLSWADGDAADKTFNVPIVNDSTTEGDETFSANLSGASGASLGIPNSATGTIMSNDAAAAPVPAGDVWVFAMVFAGILAYGIIHRGRQSRAG